MEKGLIRQFHAEEIEALLARFPQKKSAVLHLMHIAQQVYGYMSPEAMREVADILDLDPTHVLSLAGFYSLFYEEPVGKYVLEICNDLACALRGGSIRPSMGRLTMGYSPSRPSCAWADVIARRCCNATCDLKRS
jgi:NADH-quinone oxidoreductase subunit E